MLADLITAPIGRLPHAYSWMSSRSIRQRPRRIISATDPALGLAQRLVDVALILSAIFFGVLGGATMPYQATPRTGERFGHRRHIGQRRQRPGEANASNFSLPASPAAARRRDCRTSRRHRRRAGPAAPVPSRDRGYGAASPSPSAETVPRSNVTSCRCLASRR